MKNMHPEKQIENYTLMSCYLDKYKIFLIMRIEKDSFTIIKSKKE